MDQKTTLPSGAEEINWDLSDLYASIDDPTIERDLSEAEARADKLAEKYRGRVAELDAQEMRKLIQEYEQIIELSGKVGAFAYLFWTVNSEDPARGALLQKVMEHGSRLSQKLVFVTLEWANAPDAKAKELIADPALADYLHWLELERRYRPYLLTEPEEKILTEKATTGRQAWYRFFEEVHSTARYEWDGEMLPLEKVLNNLYKPNREGREKAAASITQGLENMRHQLTYIFNTILADHASDDRLRGYPTWVTSRNMDNEVDDEAVEALVRAVVSRYDIVARYYRLKRNLLGLDELYDYDRYAPLPTADHRYPWEQGREIVLKAYQQFHPRMAEIAEMFFDKRWIDAAVKPGKQGGAYSHQVGPSVHPYVFMNYEGKPRDVMTLAHELGHGIHQYLYREQGMLQGSTPLTTAETASVFGEVLVFQDLMSHEEDAEARLAMLTTKLEESFATVFRQVAMNRFEDGIHIARREEGELTTERFNEIWLETQRAMFDGSVTMRDEYGLWWSYIPHFVDRPGYVYAYAFGELLVMALYARYKEVGQAFVDAYLGMLMAGGSDWPHKLVKPLGVDLSDPDFWSRGLQMLDDMVTEATELAEKV